MIFEVVTVVDGAVDGAGVVAGVGVVDGVVVVDGVDGVAVDGIERWREPGGRCTIGVTETWVVPELRAKAAAVPPALTDATATTTPATMATRRLVRAWLHENFTSDLLGYRLSIGHERELTTREM
jgi:hypothetical protein